jgi:hypothetical protein
MKLHIAPVAICLVGFLSFTSCKKGDERLGPPKTCDEAMERFSENLIAKNYKAAYAVTAKQYQEKVSFSDFIEKQRELNEKTNNPSKWGIWELGCFETDRGHGCNIDFGHDKKDGEVVPVYGCIVMKQEEAASCFLDEIDCHLKTD